ncbi:hypothetical protein F2Q69_00013131 [Brassica cretica]|uniref:Uncharacterized protein n=1 Tax=Brassica cretica TaxID=69181 RepID=A0A8S9QT79_BRACR|nr:hypothetical protein F2Q69_00013131 [Brassica cretica]
METLLKDGGSRMLLSSSVCLDNNLCTAGPLGLTLSSSAPAFLVPVSSLKVYQGTWPGKAVVRWSEPWIRNLEAGIRNLEAGTRNPEVWLFLLDEWRWNSSVHGAWAGFLSRNNPVKFDKYSKALYPPSYQLRPKPAGTRDCGSVIPYNQHELAGMTRSCVSFRSDENTSFLAPRWLGLRGFAGIDGLRHERHKRRETRRNRDGEERKLGSCLDSSPITRAWVGWGLALSPPFSPQLQVRRVRAPPLLVPFSAFVSREEFESSDKRRHKISELDGGFVVCVCKRQRRWRWEEEEEEEEEEEKTEVEFQIQNERRHKSKEEEDENKKLAVGEELRDLNHTNQYVIGLALYDLEVRMLASGGTLGARLLEVTSQTYSLDANLCLVLGTPTREIIKVHTYAAFSTRYMLRPRRKWELKGGPKIAGAYIAVSITVTIAYDSFFHTLRKPFSCSAYWYGPVYVVGALVGRLVVRRGLPTDSEDPRVFLIYDRWFRLPGEHDVLRCFSEHGGTLLMSWRSWPEPVRNLALAAVELVSSGYGRLGPPFYRDPDPGEGTRNLEAGTLKPEAGVISSWNIFPNRRDTGKYLTPPSVMLRCPTEFECAPDGGSDEVAIYVAHMEACFRGNIPTLIAGYPPTSGFVLLNSLH